MNKVKLFLDFDGTITNSSKAICECYNEIYKDYSEFKPANWWENNTWNYTDICPLMERPNKLFSDKRFFDRLEFINCNTKEIIEEISKYYEIIITSIGTPENISYKSLWLKTNLPVIKEYIFLSNEHCTMDKSVVNMSCSIFIDDVNSNLESSNAKVKIIFGDEYPWNETSLCLRCYNWSDVYVFLMDLYKNNIARIGSDSYIF